MPESSESVVWLPADVDLHARPAARFVRTAIGFNANVQVFAADRRADAKSILAVLALGARRGTALRLSAEGRTPIARSRPSSACVAGLVE